MGAAASVKHIYAQALGWFRNYIDQETYLADFDSLDKDHDGGVTFGELERWVTSKAQQDPSWAIFKANKQVLVIAHKNAALYQDAKSSGHAAKVVDVGEFKALLIHMFAVSILWRHFDSADHWEAAGDVGNQQLTLQEFTLACKTLCAAHEHEELSDETILDDFEMLDTNHSDTIGFMEVCNYCCQFIDMGYGNGEELIVRAEQMKSSKVEKLMGAQRNTIHNEEKWDPKGVRPKHLSTDEKTSAAIEALKNKLMDEGDVMDAVTSGETVKLQTTDEVADVKSEPVAAEAEVITENNDAAPVVTGETEGQAKSEEVAPTPTPTPTPAPTESGEVKTEEGAAAPASNSE